MKIYALLAGAILNALLLTSVQAQAVTTTTTSTTTVGGSSAPSAVDIAKDGVVPSLRDHVVSVYGVGTPAAIQSWWVIFYDPAVASHGRAVKVENGKIVKTYEAKSGVVYGEPLTFAPSQVTAEGPALSAAQTYAGEHALAYDRVRVLLRMTPDEKGFSWRVQLLNGTASKGFVFVNASDGAFALYEPAGSVATGTASNTGGVEGDVHHAANKVKNTFLGIGGDLQEFFTGERTVDQ